MVPLQKDLQRGTPVNIILKADQRSGKLTSGQIQDILTRGDHPHGIKVRLSDGQIGRVQSLCSDTTSVASSSMSLEPTVHNTPINERSSGVTDGASHSSQAPTGIPVQAGTNLMDYVKPSKTSRTASHKETEKSPQEQLEKMFPELDSGLIAAILDDYSTLEAAEGVLGALCRG
ncbi:MAG: hypothetical protein Q9226_007638 [Calogaya cf. arnoldii]